MTPFCGLSSNLDQDLLQAALPLMEEEKVAAIEWSFDTLYNRANIPNWFVELLQTFGNEGRLTGHGVYYSLFSARFSEDQKEWLRHLGKMCRNFHFDHITEHFGFMTGSNFHEGAPLSVPFTSTTLAIGQDRLKRMSEACECPVGIENLAYAYSFEDVKRHGEFLEKLVAPVNGFIILDLHNVYCQAHNFRAEPEKIIDTFPLSLVKEIHLSGGSWETSDVAPQEKIRRDTHDDGVPQDVFEILRYVLSKCPSLKFVMLEQLSSALNTIEKRKRYQQDFIDMLEIVSQNDNSVGEIENNFMPLSPTMAGMPVENELLFKQQRQLADILENATDHLDARQKIEAAFLNTAWEPKKWEPHMLETAVAIAKKWRKGFG